MVKQVCKKNNVSDSDNSAVCEVGVEKQVCEAENIIRYVDGGGKIRIDPVNLKGFLAKSLYFCLQLYELFLFKSVCLGDGYHAYHFRNLCTHLLVFPSEACVCRTKILSEELHDNNLQGYCQSKEYGDYPAFPYDDKDIYEKHKDGREHGFYNLVVEKLH